MHLESINKIWKKSFECTFERPARTTTALCADIGCSLEDLPEVMNNRNG